MLTWYKKWDEVLDSSDAPSFKWFKGGKLNASYNCIDRHLAKNKNKTAIHFVPELEEESQTWHSWNQQGQFGYHPPLHCGYGNGHERLCEQPQRFKKLRPAQRSQTAIGLPGGTMGAAI